MLLKVIKIHLVKKLAQYAVKLRRNKFLSMGGSFRIPSSKAVSDKVLEMRHTKFNFFSRGTHGGTLIIFEFKIVKITT
jgi:hypothetical protein